MSFDAKTAKGLKPGEHIKIADCPGLRLVATDKRKTWTYRFRSPVDGRIRQARLGAWPALSLAKAISEWSRVKEQRDAGTDIAMVRRQQRQEQPRLRDASAKRAGALTVRQVANEYVTRRLVPRRKERGLGEVQRMFDMMLGPIGEVPAVELTRAQAYQMLETHQTKPVVAAKLRAELRAAWTFALDAGLLAPETSNWWGDVMRGQLRSRGKKIEGVHIGPVKRSLSADETGRLIRWLPNFPRVVADVLTLYLWTLARGAEICAMEAGEVTTEADGMWWTVPKIKTKNARHETAFDQRVPLVGRARSIVERRLELYPSGYLFPSTGRVGYVEQKTVQTAVHYHQPYSKTRAERRRPRLTVTHWAPHDLRRTSRTLLAAINCPEEVAESMMGHVHSVYNRHKYDPMQRHWAKVLDAHLEGLASAP